MKKKNNIFSLIGTILLNLSFLAMIIFFISTQIQVEQATSQFVIIEGEVFYQKEKDGIIDTFISAGNEDVAGGLKTWKVHGDIQRDTGTHITMLVQMINPDNSEFKVVEVSKFKLEKREEGFFADS